MLILDAMRANATRLLVDAAASPASSSFSTTNITTFAAATTSATASSTASSTATANSTASSTAASTAASSSSTPPSSPSSPGAWVRGIALDGGALLLAYWDLGLGQLRAVRCERQPARCSAPTLLDRGGRRDLSDFGAGAFPDLRAPPQGLGGAAGGGAVLAYFVEGDSGGELRLLSCPDANCTAPHVSTGARGGAGFGRDASVAFAPGALLVTLLDLQGADSPLRMAARLAVFRPGSARESGRVSSLESAARGLPLPAAPGTESS